MALVWDEKGKFDREDRRVERRITLVSFVIALMWFFSFVFVVACIGAGAAGVYQLVEHPHEAAQAIGDFIHTVKSAAQ